MFLHRNWNRKDGKLNNLILFYFFSAVIIPLMVLLFNMFSEYSLSVCLQLSFALPLVERLQTEQTLSHSRGRPPQVSAVKLS